MRLIDDLGTKLCCFVVVLRHAKWVESILKDPFQKFVFVFFPSRTTSKIIYLLFTLFFFVVENAGKKRKKYRKKI